jgi:hypothetical protein
VITFSTLGLVILALLVTAPEVLWMPFVLVAAVFGAIWDILLGKGNDPK